MVGTPQGKKLPKGKKAKESKESETKENLTASFRLFKDLFTSSLNLLRELLPEIKMSYLYGSLDYLKIAEIWVKFDF